MFRERNIRPLVEQQRKARQRVIERERGVSAFDMVCGNGCGGATAKVQSDLLWMHMETRLLLELDHTFDAQVTSCLPLEASMLTLILQI